MLPSQKYHNKQNCLIVLLLLLLLLLMKISLVCWKIPPGRKSTSKPLRHCWSSRGAAGQRVTETAACREASTPFIAFLAKVFLGWFYIADFTVLREFYTVFMIFVIYGKCFVDFTWFKYASFWVFYGFCMFLYILIWPIHTSFLLIVVTGIPLARLRPRWSPSVKHPSISSLTGLEPVSSVCFFFELMRNS